uniref:Putative secreted protein n=1 Tax=Lutzomyia longipalpis TaxID=7200 RepID=A0A7G3AQ02_LUTLO
MMTSVLMLILCIIFVGSFGKFSRYTPPLHVNSSSRYSRSTQKKPRGLRRRYVSCIERGNCSKISYAHSGQSIVSLSNHVALKLGNFSLCVRRNLTVITEESVSTRLPDSFSCEEDTPALPREPPLRAPPFPIGVSSS